MVIAPLRLTADHDFRPVESPKPGRASGRIYATSVWPRRSPSDRKRSRDKGRKPPGRHLKHATRCRSRGIDAGWRALARRQTVHKPHNWEDRRDQGCIFAEIRPPHRDQGRRLRPAIAQIAAPFVITARAADNVKIGLDDPLTGTYAELGKNEQIGCELAIEQINAKGGILGRQVRAAGRGFDQRRYRHGGAEGAQADRARQGRFPARQRQFGDGDRDRPGLERTKTCRIVTGGHTDAVTGNDCHWNVFRVCNTTRMETNSVAKTLFNKYGKKWYFITPDYAFGHTLQQGFEASLKKFGGTEVGAAGAARRHRFFLLPDQGAGGESRRHHLPAGRAGHGQRAEAGGAVRPRQALPHRRRAAGTRGARRPAARCAHRHLGLRMVLEAAQRAACRRNSSPQISKRNGGKVPTARHWFGYVAAWTCALVANQEKTLDALKLAKALEGFKLPPEIALMPYETFLSRRRPPADADALCRPCAWQKAASPKICSRSTSSSKASTRRCRSPKPAASSNGGLTRLSDRSPIARFVPCTHLARPAGEGRRARRGGDGRPGRLATMTQLILFNLFNGLIIGAFYALMALGPVADPQSVRGDQFRAWRLPGHRRLSRLHADPLSRVLGRAAARAAADRG